MDPSPSSGEHLLNYATPVTERKPSKRGKGFLAAAGSFTLPGLGQIFAGRWKRGLAWFAVYGVVTAVGFVVMGLRGKVLLALVPITVLNPVFVLGCVIDAYLTARRHGGRMLARPWARYLAGVAVVAGGMVAMSGVTLLLHRYWAEAYVMPTASMSPTVQPGDRILVAKRYHTWRRWEVVTLVPPVNPKTVFCKRIAGLPGETVEIRGGVLHVNGKPVPAPPGLGPFTSPGSPAVYGTEGHPLTLGPEEYFVLGDNSPISGDSRYWATPLTESALLGHVTAIYWPLRRARVMD